MLSDADLSLILGHARSLAAAAEELDGIRGDRAAAVQQALARWIGPSADEFRARAEHDDRTMRVRAGGLRAGADAWAAVWARAVERNNAELGSFGSGTADLGGSGARLPVLTPSAATGYAPTGGIGRHG
jgi:uncharacterized protein YukE